MFSDAVQKLEKALTPNKLIVLAIICAADAEIAFADVRRQHPTISRGLLSQTNGMLIADGLITSTKRIERNTPKTYLKATAEGRTRFWRHCAAISQVADAVKVRSGK